MAEAPHDHEDLAAAVAEAIAQLGEGPGAGSRIRKTAAGALSPRRGTVSLDDVEALHQDLADSERIVATLIRKAVEQQDREARAHPFEEAWLGRTRRVLRQASARSPKAWRSRWLGLWCQAVSASQWATAQQVVGLAREPQAPAIPEALPRLLTDLVTALKGPDEGAALEVLGLLGDEITPDDPLEVRLTLGVLEARASLRLGRVDEALALAREGEGASRAVGSALGNLCQAVLAEALLEHHDLEEAAHCARGAREGKDAGCDALVVSGLVEQARTEAGADTVVADDFYDVAALRFGMEATRGHLLQPVPPQLLWRVARRLRLTDTRGSLDLYTQALDGGLGGGAAETAERQALVERASVLEELDRGHDAAADLRSAASLYLATQPETAIRLLRNACRLDSEEAGAYWELGEALRLSIDSGRPRQAERRAVEAEEAFATGFSLQPTPEREESWTLVSAATLSRRDRSRSWQDCAVDIERALLQDGGSQRSLAFLVLLLRDSGYPAAALAAVPGSVLDAPSDEALVEQCSLCYLGVGDFAEGLALIEGFELFNYLSTNLHLIRAWLHLCRDEPDEALASADQGGDEGRALLTRALCRIAVGDSGIARSLLEQARRQQPADDPSLRPWCDYLLGELDDAVDAYRTLVAAEPAWVRDPVARLDLGQVLLVRGGAGDLDEAREQLLAAVHGIEAASDLVSFLQMEHGPLRSRLEAVGHGAAAMEILEEARSAARDRLGALRSAQRPDGPDALLTAARVALAGGRALEAFDAYTALADQGLDWAQPGAWDAAVELVRAGDQAVREGSLEEADSWYAPVAERGALLGETAMREVAARRALAATERLGGDPAPGLTTLVDQDGIAQIASAASVFARDPHAYWLHHDALGRLAQGLDDDGRREDLRAAVDGLPLEEAYRAGTQYFDTDAAPFPLAVELILPIPSHGLLDEDSELRHGIPAVRQRVLDDLGVRIPGARVYESDAVPPGQAALFVYGDMATDLVDIDPDDPVSGVVAAFENVVRDNVFRWLAPDDVTLWLAGWDEQLTPVHPLPEPPQDQLGLARVLRELLREGLSVASRREIVGGFIEAEGSSEPLAGLQAVRRALYPATLGPRGGTAIPVPEDLASRLSAGVIGDSGAEWALPHDDARALRGELLALAGAFDREEDQRPLATRDPLLRLVVARLVADHRPRVYVVDESEWS